ncbi:hypothetical protein [Novosphingobium sp. CECT 9465]|uniref:hypothetical protein n=1 Tax=Novosphingobium sp. CECT 9465 TaxID=2829794 RepID=UPI001E398F58|nr:hypothetical protein [Novosphingobium sp. CECT 9465]
MHALKPCFQRFGALRTGRGGAGLLRHGPTLSNNGGNIAAQASERGGTGGAYLPHGGAEVLELGFQWAGAGPAAAEFGQDVLKVKLSYGQFANQFGALASQRFIRGRMTRL